MGTFSFAEFMREGGWGMWPILLLLMLTIAIVIERAVFLRKSVIDKNKLMGLLRSQISAGNIQGVAIFMKQFHFGNRPYAPQYEEVWSTADIVKRVSEEPSAIGFGSFDGLQGRATPDLKVVAVSEKEGAYYSRASQEDVLAGKYPYLRDAYFYVNRAPGKPLDPFVKEYLRMVLSKEGQQAMTDQEAGFLPLKAAEAAVERAKLE